MNGESRRLPQIGHPYYFGFRFGREASIIWGCALVDLVAVLEIREKLAIIDFDESGKLQLTGVPRAGDSSSASEGESRSPLLGCWIAAVKKIECQHEFVSGY
ncbi:MAG: hypothetical protein KF851_02815 [Pirellulaceae bacterium]|nr:hypothetical protein [Pirellulaceae bacterium]